MATLLLPNKIERYTMKERTNTTPEPKAVPKTAKGKKPILYHELVLKPRKSRSNLAKAFRKVEQAWKVLERSLPNFAKSVSFHSKYVLDEFSALNVRIFFAVFHREFHRQPRIVLVIKQDDEQEEEEEEEDEQEDEDDEQDDELEEELEEEEQDEELEEEQDDDDHMTTDEDDNIYDEQPWLLGVLWEKILRFDNCESHKNAPFFRRANDTSRAIIDWYPSALRWGDGALLRHWLEYDVEYIKNDHPQLLEPFYSHGGPENPIAWYLQQRNWDKDTFWNLIERHPSALTATTHDGMTLLHTYSYKFTQDYDLGVELHRRCPAAASMADRLGRLPLHLCLLMHRFRGRRNEWRFTAYLAEQNLKAIDISKDADEWLLKIEMSGLDALPFYRIFVRHFPDVCYESDIPLIRKTVRLIDREQLLGTVVSEGECLDSTLEWIKEHAKDELTRATMERMQEWNENYVDRIGLKQEIQEIREIFKQVCSECIEMTESEAEFHWSESEEQDLMSSYKVWPIAAMNRRRSHV